MKKIYSDSEIWNKEWYLKYSLKLRMLLKYIFDNAHTSGVFEPNFIMLSFYMGDTVTKDDIIELQRIYQEYECKKNPDASLIEELQDGKFWVVGMAYFQCGALSQNTPAHKKIIETLLNYGLLERVVSQYKEQDKKKISLLNGLLKHLEEPEIAEENNPIDMVSPSLGLPIDYPSANHRDKDRDRDMDRESLYPQEDFSKEDGEITGVHALAGVKPVQTCVSKAGRAEHYDGDVSNSTVVDNNRLELVRSKKLSTSGVPAKPRKLSPESAEVCAFCKDYGEVKEGKSVQLSAKERQQIARVLNLEGGIYDAQYWRDVFWNAKGGWEFNKGNGNIERSKCALNTILEKHGEIYRKELPLKYLPKPKPQNPPQNHADLQKKSEEFREPIPEHVKKKVAEIGRKISGGA